MKKNNTLTILACLVASLTSVTAFAKNWKVSPTPNVVVLVPRGAGGTYATETYSFRFQTQGDIELTRNNYELDFQGDTFYVNTVTDDRSYIYDLGKMSCKDIQSELPQLRDSNPIAWLYASEASPLNLKAEEQARAREGHCFLVENNDRDGRVVTLFHVDSVKSGKMAVIDEIEVLDVIDYRRR